MGFVAAAWVLSRIVAPWPAWAALAACAAILWTVPLWRREKATALVSADDFGARLRGGRPSLVHFYSDF